MKVIYYRSMRRLIAIVAIVACLLPAAASAAPTLRDGYAPFDRAALTARSAIVIDAATGETLFSHRAAEPHPAASLSKLMTAVTFLEQKPLWTRRVSLKEEDEVGGGRLRLSVGSLLTIRDLFYSALVGSANNAAMALARNSGLTRDVYIREMNIRAATLGMTRTRFFEPTGMDPRNTTTADDMARLARYAFQNYTIRRATTTGEYRFTATSPRVAKIIKNTNRLLVVDPDIYITGGKTGYLDESKYNLAIRARDEKRSEVVVVVFGAPTRDASFDEAKALAKWAWTNYDWSPHSSAVAAGN